MADEILTTEFDALRVGEWVAVEAEAGFFPVFGRVEAIDAAGMTIMAGDPATNYLGQPVDVRFSRIRSVTRYGPNPRTVTVVRTYKASKQADVARRFESDASALARAGYEPTSQSWAQGEWGTDVFWMALALSVGLLVLLLLADAPGFLATICTVLLGFLFVVYLLVAKPSGTLTVSYAFRQPALA